MKVRMLCAVLLVLAGAVEAASGAKTNPIDWHEWSPASFAKAKAQGKLVLLDGAAEWCHWCHVMESTTYNDPKVVALIKDRFLAIRVDVDARPEVAERYGDWGWPATIVFSSSMEEMRKMRGYIEAPRFLEILTDAVAQHDKQKGQGPYRLEDPPPKRPLVDLTAARVAELREMHEKELSTYFDPKGGGWGYRQKSSTWMNVEHAFLRFAASGKPYYRWRAVMTLDRLTKIMDPVWGGVYQYSTHGDWDHPHFEKLMTYQAGTLENYAQGFLVTGSAGYLDTAKKLYGYMKEFLSGKDGAFYVSQDADLSKKVDGHAFYPLPDAERRKLGLPRIDTNVYGRENGLAIAAVCQLYAATADRAHLAHARAAADRVLASHGARGGVSHAAGDAKGLLHLADNAAMGRGLIALYEATGEAKYFAAAVAIADALERELWDSATGAFWAHSEDPHAVGVLTQRRYPVDENVNAGRFFLRLAVHQGAEARRKIAVRALTWLSAGDRPKEMGRFVGAYLTFLEEANGEPLHVTVVGPDGDPAVAKLVAEAHRFQHPFRIVERHDPKSKTARKLAVPFPEMEKPAAFVCANGGCSAPIEDPAKLAPRLTKLLKR
jgi:uncharacterized protein YyaL (SSP411 family)